MGMPGMPEMIIILLIVVLLFGAKKIPDLAKGMGKGIKDFKKAISDDDKKEEPKVEVASKMDEPKKDEIKKDEPKKDTTESSTKIEEPPVKKV